MESSCKEREYGNHMEPGENNYAQSTTEICGITTMGSMKKNVLKMMK